MYRAIKKKTAKIFVKIFQNKNQRKFVKKDNIYKNLSSSFILSFFGF